MAAGADDAVAADIICSLRGADLAGWTPPWGKGVAVKGREEAAAAGELSWPAVARGKRSRRAAAAAAGKGRCARSSPASPLDYSGRSGSGSFRSGASTSGGEDGASCSPWHRRAFTAPAAATKVGSAGRPPATSPAPPPRAAAVQRRRKKMSLPEVQQLVRSLAAENGSLHEEMRALKRACKDLSKENDSLETRVEQSNPRSRTDAAREEPKGKRRRGAQPTQDGFVLPDLNLLPAQDTADMDHSTPLHSS